MDEARAAAERLYGALAAKDQGAILETLTADFVGEVSPGMPLGVGGRHDGPVAMLRDVWGVVFGVYDLEIVATDMLPSDGGRITVLGAYRGIERASGAPIDAVFAHVLNIRDGKVARLVQITDTASWMPAAAA